jgi:hypothetical protein
VTRNKFIVAVGLVNATCVRPDQAALECLQF